MTLSKNLTSVLFASTVLIGSSLVGTSDAHANAWMVKKVSKATQPYCAMIKRYSKDRVLSFAQRNSSQVSAAIDFGDRFLDKGRAYSITLSDGDGFSRRFEVKPASSSAVVVKLNKKDPILERIAAKGDLTVNIAGVLSTFNVSDLGQGLDKLESCQNGEVMRTAQAPSTAEQLADIAPAAGDVTASHSLYSKTANAKIRQLESDKEALEKSMKANEAMLAELENKVLSTQNTSKTKEDALVAQISQLQSTIEKQSYDISQTKIQLTDRDEKIAFYQGMDGQYKGVQEQLNTAQANLNAAMQQNNALSAQIATLQQNGARANEQAAVIGQLNAQLAQLQQANAGLTQEITALRQTAAQTQQLGMAASQKDVEIQNLHKALKAAQQTIASLEKGMASVQASAGNNEKLAASQEEMNVLSSQLQAVEMEKKKLQAELSQVKRQIDTSKSDLKITRLEKALEDTNRALDRAGKENASLYQKFVQAEKDLEKAKMAKADNADWDVKKATSRFNEAQREIRRLAMHLENHKKQCEVEKANIESLLFDPKITEKKQRESLAALEGKIGQLTKSQQSCEAKVAELQNTVSQKVAAAQPVAVAPTAKQVAAITPAAGAIAPAVIQTAEAVKEDRSVALVSVLKGANVKMNAELESFTSGTNLSGASFDQGYGWQSGKITGSYERFEIKGGSLESWSTAYNDALSAQCSGDFAVMPSKKSKGGVVGNDVACVNGDFGTTSSIVFTQTNGYFEVYKLSGTIQDMAELMDSREKLSSSVKKSL